MKKRFLGLLAMASMLFATSCSDEEVLSQSTGNEVKVTFTTELRNDVKSRAVGDDTDGIDQLEFAVYDESGNHLEDLDKTVTTFTDLAEGKKQATVEVVLVKGQTYSFAFWAQNAAYSAYKFIADDATVSVDYKYNSENGKYAQKANQRNADAFFGQVLNHKVTGTFTMDVTLKRPFSQVNFLTSIDDIKNARKAGFNPSQSQILVKNVASKLNILTGAVTEFENAEVTFDYANLVMKTDAVNEIETTSINGVTGTWKYLATAYFLCQEPTAETKINATMNINAKDEDKAVTTIVANDVPAQRNYRTNIYGNLLTSNGQFTVVIDPSFDGDHNEASGVYTINSTNLNDVLDTNKGLTGDIVYNVEGLSTETSISVEIPSGTAASNLTFNFTDLPSSATLEVKNADGGDYAGTVILKVPETTTLTSTTVTLPSAHVILAQGGFGDTSASTSSSTLVIAEGASVGTLTVEKGNVEIEAGGEVNIVKKGESAGIVFVYVEEGAKTPAVAENDKSSIIISEEEESTGDYTINLSADLELGDSILYLNRNTVINGNGNKLVTSANRAIRLTTSDINVEINELNIVSSAVMKYPSDVRGISIDGSLSNIQLTLNNCSIDFTDASTNDWTYAVNASSNGTGHKITVNGGTYEGANVINVHGAENEITVENATLNCLYPVNEAYYGACIWVKQGGNSTLTATGNTFNGDNAVAINAGTGNTIEESENTDNTKVQIAKVGSTYYSDLEEADKVATKDNPIVLFMGTKLKKDITLKNRLVISLHSWKNKLELDGDGHTITYNATTENRLIDVPNTSNGPDFTLKNITILNNISWVQRGLNYNTNGTLTLENVTIKHADGCSMNYAVNLPGKSIGCKVVINNCNIGATANALNIWGKDTKADVTDSDLYVIDNSEKESYSVIALNNDGAGSSADGTVVNVTGGSLKATGTYAEGSDAVRNNTETGVVNISSTTTVEGEIEEMVAIVYYEGSTDYYSKQTLAGAIQTAKETNAAGVRLLRDVKLTETLTIDDDVVLDLNGKTITGPSEARDANNNRIHVIVNNANLTIKNGTVKSVADNGGSAIYNATGATLTIENVEVSGAPKADGNWPSYAINNYGNLTVTSATVKSYHGGIATGGNGVTVIEDATVDVGQSTATGITSYTLYTEGAAKLTVNGGTFANTATDAKSTGGAIACEGGDNAIEINGGNFSGGCGLYGSYVIKGGTFDRDVTSYVADGYKATESNGTWTVAKSE